jgi:glycosyltransferase involved in cell wall biosynthesis
VGSLLPRKNVSTIISAFTLNHNKDLKLLILGDGYERLKLETQAQPDKRIRFFGHSDDVVEFLHMSDFYISASISEGLPNSIMEAMACGVPVILSDIEAHRELLEKSDWFFKPDDVNKLLMILNTLFDSDWDTLSAEMTNSIHSFFSARLMSENYQNLYKEIL